MGNLFDSVQTFYKIAKRIRIIGVVGGGVGRRRSLLNYSRGTESSLKNSKGYCIYLLQYNGDGQFYRKLINFAYLIIMKSL